ncbi:hypothetical protein INR49_009094 [Caranx melampygus]|nr:hypothetical protein INR49_009094 [Caranx melampygus]
MVLDELVILTRCHEALKAEEIIIRNQGFPLLSRGVNNSKERRGKEAIGLSDNTESETETETETSESTEKVGAVGGAEQQNHGRRGVERGWRGVIGIGRRLEKESLFVYIRLDSSRFYCDEAGRRRRTIIPS